MNESLDLSPLPAGISPLPQYDQENLNVAALMSEADMLCDMGSPGALLSPMIKLGKAAKPRPPALGDVSNNRRESVPWLQNLIQWGSPKGKQLGQPCSPSRSTLALGVSPMALGRESMMDFIKMEQESIRDGDHTPEKPTRPASLFSPPRAPSGTGLNLGEAVAVLGGAKDTTKPKPTNKRESVLWFDDLVKSSQQTLENIDLAILDEAGEEVRPANCLEDSPSKDNVDPCAATPPAPPRPSSPATFTTAARLPSPAPAPAAHGAALSRLSGASCLSNASRFSGNFPSSMLRPPSPSLAHQFAGAGLLTAVSRADFLVAEVAEEEEEDKVSGPKVYWVTPSLPIQLNGDSKKRDESLKLIGQLLRDCLLSKPQFEAARQAILLQRSAPVEPLAKDGSPPRRTASPARMAGLARPASTNRGRTDNTREMSSSRKSAGASRGGASPTRGRAENARESSTSRQSSAASRTAASPTRGARDRASSPARTTSSSSRRSASPGPARSSSPGSLPAGRRKSAAKTRAASPVDRRPSTSSVATSGVASSASSSSSTFSRALSAVARPSVGGPVSGGARAFGRGTLGGSSVPAKTPLKAGAHKPES